MKLAKKKVVASFKRVKTFFLELIKSSKAKKAALVLLIILFFWLIRGLFVAAWVNFRPVLRLNVIKNLETTGGQQVLDNLVEESLIFQEARKNQIKITKEEIAEELAGIEALVKEQGMTLESALSLRGQTVSDLEKQIKLQRIIEKLLGGKINITEEEIKTYYQENKSFFGTDSKFEDLKERIKTQIFQQKLSEEYRKWMDEIKAKAKIFYFVNY